MIEPLQLSSSQEFELERMSRMIDNTYDIKILRQCCQILLRAWHTQKAATTWFMKTSFPATFKYKDSP
jgi:hypothetical protein